MAVHMAQNTNVQIVHKNANRERPSAIVKKKAYGGKFTHASMCQGPLTVVMGITVYSCI